MAKIGRPRLIGRAIANKHATRQTMPTGVISIPSPAKKSLGSVAIVV
jgi:hypothetical protein